MPDFSHLKKRLLPVGWRMHSEDEFGARYVHVHPFTGNRDMIVISSYQEEADGRWWQHISVSRPNALPSWEDFKNVKDLFAGKGAVAYQVLPPEDEYYNVNENCLHMFVPLEHRPLPDFRQVVDGKVLL